MDEQKKESYGQTAEPVAGETDRFATIRSRCYKCGKAFVLRDAFHDQTLECPHCHVKYVVGDPAVTSIFSIKDRI